MWYYKNKEFTEAPEEFQGFIYLITEEIEGNKKFYIGKKNFWKKKTLPKNSKRKKKLITKVESDWKDYYGSSKKLNERIEEFGKENYKREILTLCKTKGDMSYQEIKSQIEHNVLEDSNYYNSYIGCKIHEKHLSK